MILENIDEFFDQIQRADKNQCIDNFRQTYINSPRNPYTQEIYEADDLSRYGHRQGFAETRWLTENDIQTNKLNLRPNEKENFIECKLYQNYQYEKIKFYNVEQLDKASFDKLPLEIKPTPNWEKNPKIEKFIESQGVKVLHNSALEPRYNNITHTIYMPHQSQYSSAEEYYNDVFHEIGHSTNKELGRDPQSPEQKKKAYDRDELVAETSAIKLNKLTQNNFDKEKNLPYLKFFLSKFGDYKDIQKEELGKALIESDKVVELTNNKYINADKSQSILNEINKNENKLSQDSSVKSKGDILAKVVQAAGQKEENKRSISNEINKNENKLSQNSSVKSKGDIFAKVVQAAGQKEENKRSILDEINKNENKLSQNSSVKSKGDIFAKVVQAAGQKEENKRSISDEINKNENKLSQDHSIKSQDDIFSKAFQTAHQKIENKRSISNEKSMNKGINQGVEI